MSSNFEKNTNNIEAKAVARRAQGRGQLVQVLLHRRSDVQLEEDPRHAAGVGNRHCLAGSDLLLLSLRPPADVHSLLVLERRRHLLESIETGAAEIVTVTDSELHEVVGFDMHRGMVGLFERPQAPGLADLSDAGVFCIVEGVGDDANRRIRLPFDFTFYGTTYDRVWLNSDGNLTFGSGDAQTAARDQSRFLTGAPRIAFLYSDLNPSAGGQVRYRKDDPNTLTVIWDAVPEYSRSGGGGAS